MKRKANQVKLEKINQETMPKKELEQYFTAVKQDIDQLREEVKEEFKSVREEIKEGFKAQDSKLQTILDIVRVNDKEYKEIKLDLWEHHRRLTKLEKQLA